jgi:transposase
MTGICYGLLSCDRAHPQEVSLVSFPLPRSPYTRTPLSRRLPQAYARCALRLVQRIPALLALAEAMSVQEIAAMLGVGAQTVRDYRHLFLLKQLARLTSKRPSGHPSQLTTAQRREWADVITAGPQAAGYPAGCWNTPMRQDRIQSRFGVSYHPHYLATLLHHLGFSLQKARFVSDQLTEAKRLEGRRCKWPRILRQARQRKALLLFGAEASFAPWGALSYPWAPKGEQPAVPTRGKRQGYKLKSDR